VVGIYDIGPLLRHVLRSFRLDTENKFEDQAIDGCKNKTKQPGEITGAQFEPSPGFLYSAARVNFPSESGPKDIPSVLQRDVLGPSQRVHYAQKKVLDGKRSGDRFFFDIGSKS